MDSEATFSDALLGSSAPSPSTVLPLHPSQVDPGGSPQYTTSTKIGAARPADSSVFNGTSLAPGLETIGSSCLSCYIEHDASSPVTHTED